MSCFVDSRASGSDTSLALGKTAHGQERQIHVWNTSLFQPFQVAGSSAVLGLILSQTILRVCPLWRVAQNPHVAVCRS